MKNIWIAVALAALVAGSPIEANSQILVVGNSVQEEEATPGESYTGTIRIRNQGTEPRAVRVYQTDYLFQADGTNAYALPGSHVRSNALWMSVSPSDLVVPAGVEMDVSYTVNVPADSSLTGTYWSLVMVEPTELPTDEPTDPSQPAIGLRTTVRFGIQVVTHIAGPSTNSLNVVAPQVIVDEAGARHLEFDLVNDGEIGYRPFVSLEVFDASGARVMVSEAQRGLLYPGTSTEQRFDLSELRPGTYQAAVVVDTGSLEVFGAQFNLTIGAGA